MKGVNFGSEPYLITLCDNVRISSDVMFITHDGGSWVFRHDEPFKNVSRFGKIFVDEYTFVGARAIIMPGVCIGKHCVIGAGAVVTKSVPDYSVVAGVPAKVVSSTFAYAQNMKNKMPDKWDEAMFRSNTKQYLLENLPEASMAQK